MSTTQASKKPSYMLFVVTEGRAELLAIGVAKITKHDTQLLCMGAWVRAWRFRQFHLGGLGCKPRARHLSLLIPNLVC